MSGNRLNEHTIPAAEWVAVIKPLLDKGLELKLSPSGLSMYPFIVGGRDEVMLRSASQKAPVRGDIALFSRADGLHVLHRIHHVKNGSFYMLGDAQTGIEGPVERNSIHAIAVAIIRNGKEISCDNRFLNFLVSVWLLLRPVRPAIIATRLKLAVWLRRL
jgi:hypothetical protein